MTSEAMGVPTRRDKGPQIGLFAKLTCCAAVCLWGFKYLPILALRGIGVLSMPENHVRRACTQQHQSASAQRT